MPSSESSELPFRLNDKFSVLEAVFEGIAGFCTQLLKERLRQNQDYSIADLP